MGLPTRRRLRSGCRSPHSLPQSRRSCCWWSRRGQRPRSPESRRWRRSGGPSRR
uniref:Uncharacterized protein n=1 Tax=uncultured marine virus TaxID=186617 RepID=A0A0F7L3J2_9VIRU|nr:hypothetical protein [uncultured marine virus]